MGKKAPTRERPFGIPVSTWHEWCEKQKIRDKICGKKQY